jgi:hypothetical protein
MDEPIAGVHEDGDAGRLARTGRDALNKGLTARLLWLTN